MGSPGVSATTARRLALSVVTRVRTKGAWTHEAMSAALSGTVLDARDAGLATRLAYGSVQMWGTLDTVLDRYIDKPSRVEPRVRDALRVAAYEILFSDTPSRAAVHQGVELVRSVAPRAVGLSNAVLRRLADDAPGFPWGDTDHDVGALALATGHPVWLVERLIADLGRDQATLMLNAGSQSAPLYLSHNPFAGEYEALLAALTADGAEPAPVSGIPGAIECAVPSRAVTGVSVASGAAIVCDAAAQLAVAIAPVHPDALITDIAAGRGSKTVLLQAAAARAGGPATIVASDIHPFKIEILMRRMTELRIPGILAEVADATDSAALLRTLGGRPADLVFVDAPCTGTGTLRRHPEKRWRLKPEDPTALAMLGSRILEASSRLVRPGGFVVYSTCTVLREENEDVIHSFLRSEAGSAFSAVDARTRAASEVASLFSPEGFLRALPLGGGPDGHFAAILQHVT